MAMTVIAINSSMRPKPSSPSASRRTAPLAPEDAAARLGDPDRHPALDLDSQSDGHGERRKVVAVAERVGDLDPRERIGAPNADLGQALEFLEKTAQTGRPTRDQDLRDRQRPGLSLVELERVDEVARERLQLAPHRLACAGRLPLLGVAAEGAGRLERQGPLQLGGLGSADPELALDRGDERGPSPLEDAREVADGAVGDREGGAVVTDRHRDDGSRRVAGERRSDGAQQGERLEVDRENLDVRLPAGGDVALDRVAVRGGEHDAADTSAGVVEGLRDDVVVEHRLVDRDRERLVGPEADRVLELALVVDPYEVEGAHADTVRRDADADAAPRKLVRAEELVERRRERGDVAHLAGDDDATRQRAACELEQPRGPVVRDTRRRKLRRAPLQPHAPPAQPLGPPGLLVARRSTCEPRELDVVL